MPIRSLILHLMPTTGRLKTPMKLPPALLPLMCLVFSLMSKMCAKTQTLILREAQLLLQLRSRTQAHVPLKHLIQAQTAGHQIMIFLLNRQRAVGV